MKYFALKLAYSSVYFLILLSHYREDFFSLFVVDLGYISIVSSVIRYGQEFKLLEEELDKSFSLKVPILVGSFTVLFFLGKTYIFPLSLLYSYLYINVTYLRLYRSVVFMCMVEPAMILVISFLLGILTGFDQIISLFIVMFLFSIFLRTLNINRIKVRVEWYKINSPDYFLINILSVFRQNAISIFCDVTGDVRFLLNFKIFERVMNLFLLFNNYFKNKEVFNFINGISDNSRIANSIYLAGYVFVIIAFWISWTLFNGYGFSLGYLLMGAYFLIAGSMQILTGSVVQLCVRNEIFSSLKLNIYISVVSLILITLIATLIKSSILLLMAISSTWLLFNWHLYVAYKKRKL